jgi:cyanophycinase
VNRTAQGRLIIIGGSEDRRGECAILREVAGSAPESRVVLITTATQFPAESAASYRAIFSRLGVAHVDHLDIRTRDDAYDERRLAALQGHPAIFFTGGDQLRITTHLGDTPVMQRIRAIYEHGGVIAGTSAGAVALGAQMPYEHADYPPGASVFHHPSSLHLLPGLALLPGAILDSHFQQRGRMWRMLTAVARHPGTLCIGIDEDSAICVERGAFSVLGSGNVYVLDGGTLSDCHRAESEITTSDRVASMRDVRLHVLGLDDRFSLAAREPVRTGDLAEEELAS